jgi:rhamnosyltransferase subunit B
MWWGTVMKVVIFAGGTDGDVHPQLGIARALVLRGHQVTVLTTYNHIDMVRRCGFRVIDLFSEEDMNHFMVDIKGMNSIKKNQILPKIHLFDRGDMVRSGGGSNRQ